MTLGKETPLLPGSTEQALGLWEGLPGPASRLWASGPRHVTRPVLQEL